MTVDAAIEVLTTHRLLRSGVECAGCGWVSDGTRPALEAFAVHQLECLTSPRTVECETCGGKGYDDELGNRHEDWVPCSGCDDGRIEKGPIAYLAANLERVGTACPKVPEWATALYAIRPDESPKGGA